MPKQEAHSAGKKDKKHSASIKFEAIGGEELDGGHAWKNISQEVADLTKLQIAYAMIMACEAKAPSKSFGSNVTLKIKTVIDGRQSQSGSKTFKDINLGFALDAEDAYSRACLELNAWQRGIVPVAAAKSRAVGAFQGVQIISPKLGERLPAGSPLKAEFAGTGPFFSRLLAVIGGRLIPKPDAAKDVTEWAGLPPGWYGVFAWNVNPDQDGQEQGVQWISDTEAAWVALTHHTARWIQIV